MCQVFDIIDCLRSSDKWNAVGWEFGEIGEESTLVRCVTSDEIKALLNDGHKSWIFPTQNCGTIIVLKDIPEECIDDSGLYKGIPYCTTSANFHWREGLTLFQFIPFFANGEEKLHVLNDKCFKRGCTLAHYTEALSLAFDTLVQDFCTLIQDLKKLFS